MQTVLGLLVIYFTVYGLCSAAFDLWRKYGHRQSREDSGSAPRTVSRPSDSAARAEPAAVGADLGPSITEVAQEVLAWRSWHLLVEQGAYLERDFFLTSWRGTKWEGPVLTADALPEPGNTHGVYARPTDWRTSPYMSLPFSMDQSTKVRGVVALSGRVLQGESGYRAERATVRELWLCTPCGFALGLREILERRYACPVHLDEAPPFEPWIYL